MTFTIKERILLLQLPPVRGSILVLQQMRKFREACSFSDQEMGLMNMKMGEKITWDASKEGNPKTINPGDHVNACIAQGLKVLSDRGELSEDALGLYERFVRD